MYEGYEKLVRQNKPIVYKRIEPKKHPCKGCEYGNVYELMRKYYV